MDLAYEAEPLRLSFADLHGIGHPAVKSSMWTCLSPTFRLVRHAAMLETE